jgi:hypothetical protein
MAMVATPDVALPVNMVGTQVPIPRWQKQYDRKISNSYKLSDINR